MPFFQITYKDGSTELKTAKNKKDLTQELDQDRIEKILKKPRCRECKVVVATEHGLFCTSCWKKILNEFRKEIGEGVMSEEELAEHTLSFFVGG